MKLTKNPAILAWAELILGAAAGLLLRQLLFVQLDERGLIIPGTAMQAIVWVLSAVAAAAAVYPCLKAQLSPAGKISGMASIVMAAGMGTVLTETITGPAVLVMLHKIVLIAAAVLLLGAGIQALLHKQTVPADTEPEDESGDAAPAAPASLLSLLPYAAAAALSVFSILQLVVCYQRWSERPQLLAYFFGVGAVLCIMVYAYGLLEREAGMACRKLTVFSGTLGIFFAAAAAGQGEFTLFFAAAALWMTL